VAVFEGSETQSRAGLQPLCLSLDKQKAQRIKPGSLVRRIEAARLCYHAPPSVERGVKP